MPEPRRRSPKDAAKSSKATSKQSYSVWVDDNLLAELRAMSKAQRREIGELIQNVRASFGRPHLHSGFGIRDLSPKGGRERIYECRLNRAKRLIFTLEEPSILYFHFLGNHDDVRRFLRGAV